jgi:hypothetical protein
VGAKVGLRGQYRFDAIHFRRWLLERSAACLHLTFDVYINYHLMKISSLALAQTDPEDPSSPNVALIAESNGDAL